jgi:transposase
VTAENHTAVLKVWSKRYRDLGRTRTQVACRLHAVLADLVPGGFSREITAGQAAGLLQRAEPSNATARARCELAAEFLADLRRLDAQIRDTRTRLATEVRASGSPLTGIFGVGPVIAAAILGAAGHVSRFADRDRFAAYNGTAPIEVSSGERKIHRLSPRGNRRLNHAIHMAAITQIRYQHSPGRAYYDRKIGLARRQLERGRTGGSGKRYLAPPRRS